MHKTILTPLLIAGLFTGLSLNKLDYSTTSVVTLVGAIIQSRQIDVPNVKYKRKDCPVCKGKGWYISGDLISKVDCGYCEPDNPTETKHDQSEPRKHR